MEELLFVAVAAALAGFIDAVAGGGGLVTVPALFSAYPAAMPATLLGTNKGAAMWGTAWSASQYARRVRLDWRSLAPACLAACAGSFMGAWVVTWLDPSGLRRALPFLLLLVLVYTLARKDLGREHAPSLQGRALTWACIAIGAVIGFYDGLFGPGTGSFFVFLFVRWIGYDFLHASASAKILNLGTNVAALALFSYKGHVWWHIVAVMAVANVLGSLVGTKMALKHGSGFVRGVFILVVGALILKTASDALSH